VSDQLGVPTDAWSLAGQVRRLVLEDARGLFHASSHGEASWFDFAWEIFRLAGIPVAVEPIRLDDYPSKARRPRYTVLENRRLGDLGLDGFPDWREGLERAWRRLEGKPA
jgi:dTDP-4-dehydrorhamnose reductase